MADIKETGPKGLKYGEGTLNNNSSNLNFEELMSNINMLKKASANQLNEMFKPEYSEPIGLTLAAAGYGNSVYDRGAVSDLELSNLNEVRAANLSGWLLLGNGVLKMVGTGITTFLNGTVGTLYGLGTGIANVLDKDDKTTFLQGLWDNAFNRKMSDIQDSMEEWLPNYYSEAELNDPWYEHIISANFIGDKVLKNAGFTIGALAAAYASGGLGLAGTVGKSALFATKFVVGGVGKMFSASRGTLANINSFARGVGQVTHHAINTAISAHGEASIEAINATKEAGKDIYLNLNRRKLELLNNLDPDSPDYWNQVNAIEEAAKLYEEETKALLRDVGNSVYLMNMAILSASNLMEFAPVIKGGFQRSSKLTNFEYRLGERTVGFNEWAQGLIRGKQASITNTFDKGWGKTFGKTALTSFTEGTEEGAQNLASNSNQLQAEAKLNESAANTILGPRINPKATSKLVDYTKAFSKALYDNFGSPESPGWEEFFLGALTGGVGFLGLSPHGVKNDKGEQMYDPITHKKITSWKPKGILDIMQGGIFGTRRELVEEYEENQRMVDAVNQQLADPEFIKRVQHAAANLALEEEMDKALKQNDMFAFKNSEIGRLVEDIFFFRDKGMLDAYEGIYRIMTNIDDDTLQELYAATATPDGKTSLALEEMEKVRKEYLEKAKRSLDKIKMIQDYYDFVDLEYRDRSQLFKEELAYQYIRLDDTKRRIKLLEQKQNGIHTANLIIGGSVDENESDPLSRLTEQEQKDLNRLKRLEKVYQHRIDKFKKTPALIDLKHQIAYANAQREYDSKDVESLINRLKLANSISEIDLIICNADESVRLEVINRVYQEGDQELKSKLISQLSAANAYAKSRDRLKKISDKLTVKEYVDEISNLLYKVYINNNLDLNEVEKTLRKIHSELLEGSIDTILNLMPDSSHYRFETILTSKEATEVLSDVLEGTIEDVGYGILMGQMRKATLEKTAKDKKQKAQIELKTKLKEEKKSRLKQSYEDAIKNSTHVKNIPNLDKYRKEIEEFGVEELDKIITDALEDTGYENDPIVIKNVIKFATTIIVRKDHLGRLNELRKSHGGKNIAIDNLLNALELKYRKTSTSNKLKKSGNSFKELLKQIKEADKKGDAATVLRIVKQVADNAASYMLAGAKSADMDYIASLERKYKSKEPSRSSTEPRLVVLGDRDKNLMPDTINEHGKKSTLSSYKDGVAIYKDEQGNVSVIISGNSTRDYVKVSLTNKNLWLIDMKNESKNIKDYEKMFSSVIQQLPTGAKLYAPNGINADELRILSLYFEDYLTASEETYETNLNANDVNHVLEGFNSNQPVTAKPEQFSKIKTALKPYVEGFGEEGYGYKILIQKSGQVTLKLPILIKDEGKDKGNVIKSQGGTEYRVGDLANFGSSVGRIIDIEVQKDEGNRVTGFTVLWYKGPLKGQKMHYDAGILGAGISLTKKTKQENEKLEKQTGEKKEKGDEKIKLTDAELLILNKFYSSMHIDPATLSELEQKQIIANLEKTITLIKNNKEIPIELQPYANVVLDTNTNGTVISEVELVVTFSEVNATNDKELNGAFRGLYEVGNSSEGTPNLLQQMKAEKASTSSLEANYESVQHAELVQWCIDNILKDLKAANVPVKIIAVVGKTHADGRPNITLYTAVKANAKVGAKKNKTVKDIAKNRWLQETNDGEYIIIGTLGYNNNSLAQADHWNNIREDINKLIADNGITEGYYVSSNELHTLKISNIGEGRPAKTHYKHSSSNSVVELVEGNDKERNPLGLTLKDLKWQIIYIDEAKSVHVKTEDKIRGKANLGLGKVYVLIPTPSGSYYRHPVNPVTVDEINKDSKLYKKIDSLIESIIKKKKVEDIIALKGLLVLEQESKDLSYLDIYFNEGEIRVQFTPREGTKESINLSTNESEAIEQLKDIIYNKIRPFISVTLGHLSSPASVRMLDEAGALQLKGGLAVLSYVGANYTVVPYNTATNSKSGNRERSSLEILEQELRYQGDLIFKRGNDYYKNGELVTDQKEIEILNDISAINEGQYVGEDLWQWKTVGKGKNRKYIQNPMEGLYFFIQKGNYVTIYHKDSRGNITKVPQNKVNSLLDARTRVLNYKINQTREEAIKSGTAEAGEDIDISIEEENEKEESEAKEEKKDEKEGSEIEQKDNSKAEKETRDKNRKLDAVKRATYDLNQLKKLKVGDSITLPNDKTATITSVTFSETVNTEDSYSYSDIQGTVVVSYTVEGITYTTPVSEIISNAEYKKINKQSQKPLKGLDNSENNSSFVARLKDTKVDNSLLEDFLFEKAASIAKEKGVEFDDDCSLSELIKWYKDTINFDLNSIPSNADINTIQEMIKYCK